MVAYLIKSEKPITRQEGDTPAPIVFVVPDSLNMSGYQVKFEVRNASLRRVMLKSTEDGSITVDGQMISIPLLESDTKGKPGNHRWEMQFYNNNPVIITTGRGPFVIINESIR